MTGILIQLQGIGFAIQILIYEAQRNFCELMMWLGKLIGGWINMDFLDFFKKELA